MAFPGGYTKYQEITIDASKVDATLSDFPVFIDLSDLVKIGNDLFDTCRTDGGDIRVSLSDGTTQLAREIVSIDTAGKTGEMHIKIPSLSSTANTTIRVWYNGTDTEPTASSTYGSQAAWNSNYIGVWHLTEDPSGGTGCIKDSTGNANHGTPNGSMVSGDLVTGPFGKALNFDGTDDYISIPHSAKLNLSGDWTVSCWAKSPNAPTNSSVSQQLSKDAFGMYWDHTSTSFDQAVAFKSGSDWRGVSEATAYSADTWYLIHAGRRYSSSDLRLYTDPGALYEANFSSSGDPNTNSNPLTIGSGIAGGTPGSFFYGAIREVRIMNIELLNDWIRTEYNNQSAPSTFYSVGDEQGGLLPIIQPDPATFAMTGQTVNLLHNKKISPAAATFPMVGQSVGLSHFAGYYLSPTVASFPMSGQPVGLRHNKKLSPGAATFPMVGQAVVFDYTPSLRISPEPATFGMAGQSVRLLFNRRLSPNKDIFPISGQDVTLIFRESPHKSKALFYLFTLTGDADGVADIEIPISSFQARLRSGAPTYLSVVIPGKDQAAAINARPNGLMRIEAAYKVGDTWVQRAPIIEVWLEDIRIDEGSINKSITLTGHKQKTFTAKAITLTGATYKYSLNGALRYRFAEPDVDLNPGDMVTVGDDTFPANVISYYVGARTGAMETRMEVSES